MKHARGRRAAVGDGAVGRGAVKHARGRRGFSLVELMCIGLVGLVLVGVLAGVLASAWRQDSWNGERLDSVAAIGATLDTLRRDMWTSTAGRTVPEDNALVLRLSPGKDGQPREATYAWGGVGQPLVRNGRALGVTRPTDFGVRVESGAAVFHLTVPSGLGGDAKHRTAVGVPLVVPDAYWRRRVAFFAAR